MLKKILVSFVALFVTLGAMGGSAALAYAEVTATVTAPPQIVMTETPHVYNEVQFGMRSNDVKAVQTILAAWPAIYPQGFTTGYFGTLTKKAVENFQKKYGLTVNSRVDAPTLKKINELATGSSSPTISLIKTTYSAPYTTTVTWTTDQPATTGISYSTSTAALAAGTAIGVEDTTHFNSMHQIDVTHLAPASTYYYIVWSANASGGKTVSTQASFTTQ